jgi:hypothetical protein
MIEKPECQWEPTGANRPHAVGPSVRYVRCAVCGVIGFRRPPSRVVFTWERSDAEAGPGNPNGSDRD